MTKEYTEADFTAAILRGEYDVTTWKFKNPPEPGQISLPVRVQRTYEDWRQMKINKEYARKLWAKRLRKGDEE